MATTTLTGPRPTPRPGPLTGFTIGVTAARRRDELTALLTRRGAQVVEAPVLRIMPLADDLALRRATESCLTAPLDYVVATTGVGWRGWMSAAEGWGRGAALADACRRAVVLTRGPKATGAVRASGLGEGFSPGSEATDELLTWLLARPLTGRRIAVQEHGVRLDGFAAALRERGAEVISVPVYRWAPPDDPAPVRRLVAAPPRSARSSRRPPPTACATRCWTHCAGTSCRSASARSAPGRSPTSACPRSSPSAAGWAHWSGCSRRPCRAVAAANSTWGAPG
ncbi:uroporphyrinogen-III synthase [Streptomyces sp. NRRL S-495]|uniref:uroporphyrinogen-III synthase n=1 Tax=Streptomyces sp. NRRL S-495 TaxID=1609133 RepID=UPI0007C7BD15